MKGGIEGRYRPHAFDEPHERPVSTRVRRIRAKRWRGLNGPFELNIEQVEHETLSTWHYQYVLLGCGCRVTTSDLLRPNAIFGYWSEECRVDPTLHELAICVGLGDFPHDT